MRERKKAYGYSRQSADDKEREKFSIPYQDKRIEKWCDEHDYDLLGIFSETASAARHGTRKEYKKLLNTIEEDSVPVLVATESDRLYRNEPDKVGLELLLDEGCLEQIDLPDENGRILTRADLDGRFTHDVLTAANIHENRKKGRKVKNIMVEMFERGILPSTAPIAYLNAADVTDPTGKRRTIIVDPERGHLVKKAFELYATGEYSFESLHRKLVALGLTHGSKRGRLGDPLTVGNVDRMLKNKFYIGIMQWSGMKGPHKYPKLISKELFDKCRKVMKREDRNNGSKGKVFPFKAVLRCGYCGCSISGLPVAKNGNAWTYYRCTSGKRSVDLDYYQKKFGSKYCPQSITPSPKLENFFAEKIAKFRFPAESLRFLIKDLKEENLKKDEYREKEYGRLKAQHAKIQNEKKIVYADRKKGLIDEDFLVEQWNAIVEAEAAIKEELEKLEVKNLDYEKEGAELLDRLYHLPLIYAQADGRQKQAIILSLFQEVVVKEDRRKVRWVEPFDVLYKIGSTFKPAERDGL